MVLYQIQKIIYNETEKLFTMQNLFQRVSKDRRRMKKHKMKNIKLTEKVVKRLTYARCVAIKLVLIIITGVEAVLAVVHFLDVR